MDMVLSDSDSNTAFELARHFGLTHWPGRCPVCHSDAPNGRPLQLSPTRRGGARFRCRYCLTTFTRNRRRVARAIDRLGLIAVPRTPPYTGGESGGTGGDR